MLAWVRALGGNCASTQHHGQCHCHRVQGLGPPDARWTGDAGLQGAKGAERGDAEGHEKGKRGGLQWKPLAGVESCKENEMILILMILNK